MEYGYMHHIILMCEGGSSLSLSTTTTCSAMEMSSHRSFQCTMNQWRTAVEDPTHKMYKLEVSVFCLLVFAEVVTN